MHFTKAVNNKQVGKTSTTLNEWGRCRTLKIFCPWNTA